MSLSFLILFLKMYAKSKKGSTEDKMVGWHHQLDGHEFEQAPGVGDDRGA